MLKESEQAFGVTTELLFPHQVSVRMETGKAYHIVPSVRLLEAQNQQEFPLSCPLSFIPSTLKTNTLGAAKNWRAVCFLITL